MEADCEWLVWSRRRPVCLCKENRCCQLANLVGAWNNGSEGAGIYLVPRTRHL